MFPFTGLKRISQATQSVLSSAVEVTHGGNKQEIEVVTYYGPHVLEKQRKVFKNVLLSGKL